MFPEKVAVEYNAQDPKFYTFMTTDSEGFNSFMHVLIFYEEINEAEITTEDFDILSELLRKQHLTRKQVTTNKDTTVKLQKRVSKVGQGDSSLKPSIDLSGLEGALQKQHR